MGGVLAVAVLMGLGALVAAARHWRGGQGGSRSMPRLAGKPALQCHGGHRHSMDERCAGARARRRAAMESLGLVASALAVLVGLGDLVYRHGLR
jgi:hypothetical protein